MIRQPVYKKQADRQVFHSRAQNLDRFLRNRFYEQAVLSAVFQTVTQNRVKKHETGPVTDFSAEQDLAWAACSVEKPATGPV